MRTTRRSLSLGFALFLVAGFGFSQTAPSGVETSRACTPTAIALCLNGRFLVSVAWLVHDQNLGGFGTAVPLTSDTGYLWFFSSNNVELVIKVVDGRAFNNFFWVFFGALTDVEYLITVTDTVSGRAKTYIIPQGQLRSLSDTAAFGTEVPAPDVNVTGVWDAVIDNPGSPGDKVVFTFSQTGKDVSGTFVEVDGPDSGTFGGKISGQRLDTLSINGCSSPGFLTVNLGVTNMRGAIPASPCTGNSFAILSANKR